MILASCCNCKSRLCACGGRTIAVVCNLTFQVLPQSLSEVPDLDQTRAQIPDFFNAGQVTHLAEPARQCDLDNWSSPSRDAAMKMVLKRQERGASETCLLLQLFRVHCNAQGPDSVSPRPLRSACSLSVARHNAHDDSCFLLSEVCIPGGLRVCCAFGQLVGNDNAHGFSSLSFICRIIVGRPSIRLASLPTSAKYHAHDHSSFLVGRIQMLSTVFRSVSLLCLLVSQNNAHDYSPFFLVGCIQMLSTVFRSVSLLCLLVAQNNAHDYSPFFLVGCIQMLSTVFRSVSLLCLLVSKNNAHDVSPFLCSGSCQASSDFLWSI